MRRIAEVANPSSILGIIDCVEIMLSQLEEVHHIMPSNQLAAKLSQRVGDMMHLDNLSILSKLSA